MQRPEIVARVIDLIMVDCQERGWSIDSMRPSTNNADRVDVAHVRDQQGNALGMGSSAESNALPICAAFQSAWAAIYGSMGTVNDS
jgi:hypothetical protein